MTENLCLICKKSLKDEHQHLLQSCNVPDDDTPLAFTVSTQAQYNRTSYHARRLAAARKELKLFFPGKEFEIQPARMMLSRDGESNVILGVAYVATYIIYEK